MATLVRILGGKQFLEYTDNPPKVPRQTATGVRASAMFRPTLLPSPHKTQPIE